jgi:hypothetical protein
VNRWALWRARWRTWVPAALFFVLNLGGLVLYDVAYSGRVDVLGQSLLRLQARREGLVERRGDLEARLGRVQADRKAIETLYNDRLSTERERLTRTLAEFRTLATRAGLQPQSVSYPEEELAQFGLVKKSIVFNVDGDYNSLRQLIHLLELSPTFLSIEEVHLAGSDKTGARLQIALQMATLFVNENPGGRAAPVAPKTESPPKTEPPPAAAATSEGAP